MIRKCFNLSNRLIIVAFGKMTEVNGLEISKDVVLRAAENARLNLSDEEVAIYEAKLREVFAYLDELQEVNTDNVKPTTHGNDLKNVMRKDEPVQWEQREAALRNAPDAEDGQFKVPAILE